MANCQFPHFYLRDWKLPPEATEDKLGDYIATRLSELSKGPNFDICNFEPSQNVNLTIQKIEF